MAYRLVLVEPRRDEQPELPETTGAAITARASAEMFR